MAYPKPRNLDPVYFRVERDGKPCNRCFTDLTREERAQIMSAYMNNKEWFVRMVGILADALSRVGDELDLEVDDNEKS